MSLRTRLFSASCEARSLFQVVSPDKLGHRLFQTSTGLERMVKSHYPDLSEKVEPELRVQDSVMGEGEPEVLRADPDAPSFEMQDPYVEAPPKCVLCEHQIPVDYKNVKLLSQFISQFTGTIYPRKTVGLCTVQYDKVVREIIYARKMAMMTHKFKNQSYYDDDSLQYPRPDKVIRKRLTDAAAEYKRQYFIEAEEREETISGDETAAPEENNDKMAASNQS